jgi:hypothetical protein
MITIEFVKRTPVNGFWLLPGTRAEFATSGQAGYFTGIGAAKVVTNRTKSRKATTHRRADDRTDDEGRIADAGERKLED